jgi:hypothetical protein
VKTLHWKKLSLCIEFYVAGGAHGERQVASLIPITERVELRHEALAALICCEPAMLLHRETLGMLADRFGLYPIFVIRQAEDWRSDLWCSIEEALGTR